MTTEFIKALSEAAFINIDGFMYRVIAFYDEPGEEELHFEDEESGEMYVNSLGALEADKDEIEIFTLTKSWSPEMLG